MNDSTPLAIPAVSLDTFVTKDGRTPPCIVAHIAGKAVPLTFNYRTIRYVQRLLREEAKQ